LRVVTHPRLTVGPGVDPGVITIAARLGCKYRAKETYVAHVCIKERTPIINALSEALTDLERRIGGAFDSQEVAKVSVVFAELAQEMGGIIA
jgi:hypothetical protein